MQPGVLASGVDWAPARLGSHRTDRAYAWASLQNAGASLAFGSDAPVDSVDPLRGIYAAVPRQDDAGRPDGGWHPSERLNRSTALRAYTLGGAHAAFQDDEVGSLAPGKRADFVVLSHNLMTVPAVRLLDTEVVATFVDGTPVYRRADWPTV